MNIEIIAHVTIDVLFVSRIMCVRHCLFSEYIFMSNIYSILDNTSTFP